MDMQKFAKFRPDRSLTPKQAIHATMQHLDIRTGKLLAANGWAGPLQQLLHNPRTQEIMCPHAGPVWAINSQGERVAEPVSISEEWIDFLPLFWFQGQGRDFPKGQIIRDTLLFPSGAGIRYVYTPREISQWGPSLYIRRLQFADQPLTLDDLVGYGTLPLEAAETLRILLRAGTPIIVSGATSSGKTTLLTALVHELQRENKLLNLLVIERSHEMAVTKRCYRWAESSGIPLETLAEKATQMGLDWLVLGECTGGEAYFVAKAYTQGVPTITTLHSWDVNYAFKQLALLSQEYDKAPPTKTILNSLASLGMFAVQLERKTIGGKIVRHVTGIAEITGVLGDDPIPNYWWQWDNEDQRLIWNPGCLNEMGKSTETRLELSGETIPFGADGVMLETKSKKKKGWKRK